MLNIAMDNEKDIVFHKLNDSYTKVFANRGILEEISEEFKFFVPQAKFQKSFKEKLWDGYIRLFSKKDQTIGQGLTLTLCQWAKNSSYSYKLSGFEKYSNITEEEVKTFCEELKSTDDKGNLIEYWDSQLKGIYSGLKYQKCILQSPTNSGKSLIIYSLLRYLLEKEKIQKKILLVVPTISLVNQMYSDFCEYSLENKWEVEKYCHKIMAGESKNSEKEIYISTWQSIYNMPEEYFFQFEAIICDECHAFKATEVSSIVNHSKKAKWKIGTTGTTGSAQMDKLQLKSLFGEIIVLTTNKQQIEKGRSANIQIYALQLKRKNEEICKFISGYSYNDELEYICADKKRTELIVQLAGKQTEVTLILFNRKKYGRELYKKIKEKFPERNVYYVDGDISGEEREIIRQKVKNEKDSILVCSYKTFSTGVNIKNLNRLIFGTPMKAERTILQSIGRILRIGNINHVALYDIVDDFSYKKNKNYALEHFFKRLEYYQTEGFPVTVRKIEI